MTCARRKSVSNNRAPSRTRNNRLPRCTGPKLHEFQLRRQHIEFVRQIDNEDAGHSHVFEIAISGRKYALKVFNAPLHPDDDNLWLEKYKGRFPENEGLPSNHDDPFCAECRAYGAIIDAGLNGRITPTCYGYLLLSKEQEDQIMEAFHFPDFKRELEGFASAGPLRAILKELVPPGTPNFTQRQVRRMVTDLRRLAKIGVYPHDIEKRNYLGGRLIDFSSASTKPYFKISYGLYHAGEVWSEENVHFYSFDRMIKECGIETDIRAAPNREYCEKLRAPKVLRRAPFPKELWKAPTKPRKGRA